MSAAYIEMRQRYNEDEIAFSACCQFWKSVIRFLGMKGKTPPSIHAEITRVYYHHPTHPLRNDIRILPWNSAHYVPSLKLCTLCSFPETLHPMFLPWNSAHYVPSLKLCTQSFFPETLHTMFLPWNSAHYVFVCSNCPLDSYVRSIIIIIIIIVYNFYYILSRNSEREVRYVHFLNETFIIRFRMTAWNECTGLHSLPDVRNYHCRRKF